MLWFAYQRYPGGHECPAVFHEEPTKQNIGKANFERIVKGSVKIIPPELEGMSATALMSFMKEAIEPQQAPMMIGFEK